MTLKMAMRILVVMVLVGMAGLARGAETKMLFDFEDGKLAGFDGGKLTTENVPGGKYGLKVEKGFVVREGKQDWSGYDLLKIDVMNPTGEAVMLLVEVRDAQTKDYWTRVNYNSVVPPGKSTVTMPTDMYVGEKSRPGRALVKEKVTFLALGPEKYPLVFGNFRLEKNDTAAVVFAGLKAFDFGPAEQQVMPGYTGVNTAKYDKARGFGWDPRGYERGFDGMQPDSLFGDFVITADDAAFRVDLPNGKYHVLMNIDCPGGYWGEVQHFTHRQVSVNGKLVVDEKMTLEQFKTKYFRNAHVEDLPGVDTFSQYVEKMFDVKQFDVDVTDGKAVFEMKGDGFWPIAISAMVIYPAEKSEAGKKFWEWTTQQRREQFENYFKQVIPQAKGAKAAEVGYRVFSRNFMTPPGAMDGPLAGEWMRMEGLSVTLAQGEEGAVCFSVQPGEDIGEIDVIDSAMSSEETDPGTPRPKVTAGWLDYRISRVTMEGTVYEVKPRYWHPGPAPAAKGAGGGVTRTFWLRVKAPEKTRAETYRHTVIVMPAKGKATVIPLKVKVLPFAIDGITDVAAGPWGHSIGLPWEDGAVGGGKGKWDEEMLAKSLGVIREAGCTTVTGLPHIGVKASGGKVVLDFSRADREMALLRKYGFTQMINSYGGGLGYAMYGTETGADEGFAKKAGFADAESFLKALYGGIEEHAKANNWLPIAWNLCDEPIGKDILPSAKNAALHQKVADELGLKYSVFTGATSMEGNDAKNPHYGLVRALGMPSLNDHDEASIGLIHQDNHKFSFYNDGNRWTFGRYMKALVVHYGLAYRTTWHFNIAAGDPYYALDCREDDYCWYNTDEHQTMVPSLSFLSQIQPGLNDYRYLTTLQRLAKENGDAAAMKIFEKQVALIAGKDRQSPEPEAFEKDRKEVVDAILSVLGRK
ncbi:MAG: hypothetical protein FWD61_15420 [Phycisphaerales bacterium]|nr:hypothetical protein [Phycisphaerales bacterium]